MALFKICKGAETNLPQTLTNGYCYFCTDTTNFYIDYTDTYGALTRSKISAKYADKLRYTEDGNFVEIEPTDVLTKNNYDTAIGVATTDKNGLMSSGDKTKLDGIADGAEVNVQPDWNQNDETADDYVKNRPFYEYEGVAPTEITTYDQAEYVRQQYRNGSLTKIVINGTEYTDFTYSAGTYSYKLSTSDNVYRMEIGSYQNVVYFTPSDSVWVAYVNGTNIVSLDDKYIPDTIARITDIDGKMNSKDPSGSGSFSMGRKEDSTVGVGSHAEGYSITASGRYSHAEGYMTCATSTEATTTTTNGNDYGCAAHAEGYGTVAYGQASHAEGEATTASGRSSHAEGEHTTASGSSSHAEGDSTTASGLYSHAEGDSTTANGTYSHAEGRSSRASSSGAHSEGYDTIASSEYQHVQGKRNVEDSSNVYAHIVGNGDYNTRSNAHALDWNGNAYFAGNVYVNGTNADATGGQEVATKQYVDDLAPTEATTTESGLMSALDKIKLDGIAENADDNVQSDWSQDTDTDDSYIKNRPFKTLSGDDFSVVDNTLSLSTAKLDSIKTLGITGAQADQFIKVSSVDSNGNPTAYSVESLDDKYISSKGGTYDLTNNITFTKSNDTVSAADINENRVINFIGQPVNISGTNYIYKSGITHAGFSTNRIKEDGTAPVASYLLPNIWQMLDDQIDGDHRKLYVRPYEIEFRRYDSGWKMFYIRAEKDRTLIYNDQKLIDFNESRLINLGTPTNDTDAATKKYVDDLVPVEATTSVSGLMSSTDKVKLDGVASNAASVTIKTWTVADMA